MTMSFKDEYQFDDFPNAGDMDFIDHPPRIIEGP